MDQSRIDQIFKEGLAEHESPIDNDQLWASINNSKSAKKNGKPLFLRLLLLAILCACVVYSLSYKWDGDVNDTTSQHSTSISNFTNSSTSLDEVKSEEISEEIKVDLATSKNENIDYIKTDLKKNNTTAVTCLLYTSPSPRDS